MERSRNMLEFRRSFKIKKRYFVLILRRKKITFIRVRNVRIDVDLPFGRIYSFSVVGLRGLGVNETLIKLLITFQINGT